MKTNWLSFDEVLKIKQVEEMLEVYYNSHQYEVTMKILEQFFDGGFEMFQKMGEFYEMQGYFHLKHTRIHAARDPVRVCKRVCDGYENVRTIPDL